MQVRGTSAAVDAGGAAREHALPRAAAAATASGPAYHHNWDRLRIVASLDIVGSHLAGEHLFGGSGTPLFLMLAVALGVKSPRPGPARAFLAKRVERVLLPWLTWSLIIAGYFACRALAQGEPAFGFWRPEMWLYGPQIHLWFMPVAAFAGVLAHLAHRATHRLPVLPVACGSLALGLLALAVCPQLPLHGWPYEQWCFSVPAVCLGFGLGRLLSLERSGAARSGSAAWLGLLSLLVALLGLGFAPALPCARRYGLALALLALAAGLPNASDRLSARLSELMLGAYILHPLVFRLAVEPLLFAAHLGGLAWARIGFGFVATLGLVFLLRLTPVRRVL